MRRQEIDLAGMLDEAPLRSFHVQVVCICFFIAMFDGFDLLAMSFAATDVAKELSIPTTEMGVIFSSGLFGLMLGAFGFGALGDRIGRKSVIVVACLIMAIFSLLTVFAQDTAHLIALRFLTGLGLGGIMPTVNALTAEFAPARYRAVMMTVMFSGFSLGAFLGALLSSKIVPDYGWRSVFYVGGFLPLISVAVVVAFLPESLRFRSLRNPEDPRIGGVLSRIDPSFKASPGDVFIGAASDPRSGGVGSLFAEGRLVQTLLLWAIFFCNLMTTYSLMSWLPTILQAAGMPPRSAILSLSTFSLAGVIAGIYFARRLDRKGADHLLSAMFFAGGASVAAFSLFQHSAGLILLAVFIAGLSISGLQYVMNAIAANSYPTNARTTGLGWALGVGRIGAIIGPYVLGLLLAANMPSAQLFVLIGLPTFLCGALFAIYLRQVRGAAVP